MWLSQCSASHFFGFCGFSFVPCASPSAEVALSGVVCWYYMSVCCAIPSTVSSLWFPLIQLCLPNIQVTFSQSTTSIIFFLPPFSRCVVLLLDFSRSWHLLFLVGRLGPQWYALVLRLLWHSCACLKCPPPKLSLFLSDPTLRPLNFCQWPDGLSLHRGKWKPTIFVIIWQHLYQHFVLMN